MSKKDEKIAQLEEDKLRLQYDIEFLEKRIMHLSFNQLPPADPKKPEYAGDVSFDFWPLTDWARFGVTSKWRPGRYFQFVAGPLRFEFYEA